MSFRKDSEGTVAIPKWIKHVLESTDIRPSAQKGFINPWPILGMDSCINAILMQISPQKVPKTVCGRLH